MIGTERGSSGVGNHHLPANGAGMTLTVRPSTPGRTLQQAVGPYLGTAFVNPTSKPVGVSVSFVVQYPRVASPRWSRSTHGRNFRRARRPREQLALSLSARRSSADASCLGLSSASRPEAYVEQARLPRRAAHRQVERTKAAADGCNHRVCARRERHADL